MIGRSWKRNVKTIGSVAMRAVHACRCRRRVANASHALAIRRMTVALIKVTGVAPKTAKIDVAITESIDVR